MRKLIEDICRKLINSNLSAKVISVNKQDKTCDVMPLTGGAELLDVQLRSDDGKSKGQTIYPIVGSIVIVAPLDNDNVNYFVAMFSEIDEVVSEIENARLKVNKDGVTIAKGNDGLKEVLISFVDEVLKIYAPMNKPRLLRVKERIKQLLNDA